MDSEGETVAHMIYDPWGSPLIETYADTNLSGLENLNNFTGYTWDETLGLYFAQNRFYDPEAHRFTQEDVIKDGSNWYVYCANSPLVYVDLDGSYYILAEKLEDGSFSYRAVKENILVGLGKATLDTGISVFGLSKYIVYSIENGMKVVGGNSVTEIPDLNEMFRSAGKQGLLKFGESLIKIVSEAASQAFSYITKAVSFVNSFSEHYSVIATDAIVFKLMDMIGFNPEGRNLDELVLRMYAAYAFVAKYNEYFFGSAYYFQVIRCGGVIIEHEIVHSGTFWENDLDLYRGDRFLSKASNRIKGKVMRAEKAFEQYARLNMFGQVDRREFVKANTESYEAYLNGYQARIEYIKSEFKSFIETFDYSTIKH